MIIEITRQMARVDNLLQRYPVMAEAPDEVRGQLKRLERIIGGGCAIRALESAFSVQATDAEYDQWFSGQDEVARDFTDFLRLIGGRGREVVQAVGHKAEVLQLSRFLNNIEEHGNSPLSEAIRRHTWEQRELLTTGIVNLTRRGQKVLHIADDHVAYVGLRRGRIVRLSDPDQGPLIPQFVYDCFVFTPKVQAVA